MHTRVGLWGGSCAIRLPKMAVEILGLHEGEDIELKIEKGALIIRPSKPNYSLNELVEDAKLNSSPPSHDDIPCGEETI